jgi:hypothetical protein
MPSEAASDALDISALPLIDNHCHALAKDQGPFDLERWRMFWTESVEPQLGRDHVQHTVYYQWSMNQLAEELGVYPDEQAVLEFHNTHHGDGLSARLLRKARYDTLLLDDGVPAPPGGLPRERMAELGRCKTGWIHRLELRQQQLVVECDSFEQFVERYRAELSAARERGMTGAKSIAAYRGGLEIGPPDETAARQAFGPLKETARRQGRVRIADKRLLDFTLHLAIEQLARQNIPLQFHTGFGDTDEDMRLGNPLCLRSLFEERRYWGCPIVLIHESWPYTREAALLSALYPHVYMDVSFLIPHVEHGEMLRFTRAALAVAPASKVMAATDAWGLPEHFYLGARRARAVLGRVLGDLVAEGVLRAGQAEQAAEWITHRTARQLYGLA